MAEPENNAAKRIAGRKEFEALRQLAYDADVDPAWLDGFARAARDFALGVFGPSEELRVMTEPEAVRYETKEIQFGNYIGTPISEVPIERLTWYADAALPLQAYLRSARGQKRIDDGR